MMNKTLIAGLLALAGTAQAHVVLEQKEAEAGSSYKAVLKVGHGCEGSATRQLVVTLPPGLRSAKPVPKPGWRLSLRMEKLAQRHVSPQADDLRRPPPEGEEKQLGSGPAFVSRESHGKPVTEGLAEVTWTAQTEADQLQDAWYDEFELRAGLPEQAGELWFKVRQVCAVGESNWAEVPAAGSSTKGLKLPAARLLVTPVLKR